MKLPRLLRLSKVVEKILEQDELAREDDNYLIFKVVQDIYPELAGTAFENVMLNARYKGISFESITRARRKVQRKRPELVNKEVQEIRQAEQIEYKEYASYNHIPRID